MRPVANFTLHAILAACLAALAASSAAAAGGPAIDNEGHAFLTFELMGSGAAGSKDQHNQHLELLSYSFGASRVAKVDGITVKQGVKPYRPTLKPVFVKSWSTSGDAANFPGRGLDIAAVDGQPAATQATSGRMHKPLRARMVYDAGSVTLSGRFPGCRARATYPNAAIGHGDELYEMQDLTVTACSPGSMTLDFKKVTVRGWNPEKREE